ncbi:hypothetical protein [Bradyrhizobium sp. SZCCHNRI2007]|uniref:hypothetical protein n=1 Tax=Bradyrhizobium sp. SZCCHNRI2007 TaxID=3057281 RepID=UPI0028E291DB|nr:hypothetical protein [Bradyrhizobium sp. SZCCHNRI2007]
MTTDTGWLRALVHELIDWEANYRNLAATAGVAVDDDEIAKLRSRRDEALRELDLATKGPIADTASGFSAPS